MFVCKSPRFVFVLIPKTATRTVLAYCKETFPKGRQAGGHRKVQIPEGYEGGAIVCTVRNPYDRICSAWWSTCKRGADRYGYLREFKRRGIPNAIASFLTVVKDKPPKTIVNTIHMYPMTWWTDKIDMTHILRFENFVEEFRALPFIPNDADLPHANATITTRKGGKVRPPWQELVGAREAKLINDMYSREFREFKYEKLNPSILHSV